MFTSKYRWMAAFGTSIACHVVVFVVIGVVVALFPSAPVDKGPIQVDLVSLSGGGGGGGDRGKHRPVRAYQRRGADAFRRGGQETE